MADEGFKRKLAAILSADVEGYSRLMDDDEEATVRTLTAYRTAIADLVQQFRGRIVDTPGDNILAEFASVVDSVNCAAEIQRDLAEKNTELPDNRKMEFRIGVNLGDVIEEAGRIYGDGVNIAARVEAMANAGGICISGRVYDQIANKLELEYENLGEHQVKNIRTPVRVYKLLSYPGAAAHRVVQAKETLGRKWRKIAIAAAVIVLIAVGLGIWQFYMRRPTVEPASVEKMDFALPDKPSIAVLAFDNLSGDPEQEYFCDGLSEEIITALSKVGELFVIARNSSFTYKGKPVKVQQISEELGVRYVLEGSVRKSGDRVRITAQLIDAINGQHLWAENYDRNLEDIFEIQDEITKKIITGMRVNLTEGEQARLFEKQFETLDGVLKHAQWLSLGRDGTKESILRQREVAQEIIDIEPDNSVGYRLMGWYHRFILDHGVSRKERKEHLEKGFMFGKKALEIDESNGLNHSLLGQMYFRMRKYEKAIESGKRAVELNPNGAEANNLYAHILYCAGHVDEAITYGRRAIRLNPFPTHYYYMTLGRAYMLKEEYENALKEYKKALQRAPENPWCHFDLATAYSFLGRDEEARASAANCMELAPYITVGMFSKPRCKVDKAWYNKYLDAMRKAGFPEHPPLPLPDKPSIAVLAFDNLSGDPEQEYFSDGIAENIITALSKVGELFVIARNSSFTYKGKPVKVQQVGRELGVSYVLEGSVQKSGDRMRITAQLIDAKSGQHLWAEKYDRNLEDIFEIQDEITKKIVSAMQVNLTEGEQARLFEKQFENLDAILKYMQILSLGSDGNKESTLRYGEVAQEIIDIEPDNPVGYRVMGWYHHTIISYGSSPKENLEKAFMFAKKTLEMDESDGFAHALLGSIYRKMGKHEKAIESGKRSVELQPNGAMVHSFYARILECAGHFDEAITYSKRAIRLDPFPPYYFYEFLGRAYAKKREYENALKEFKKMLQRAPESPWPHFHMAYTYSFLGRDEEARASAANCMELAPYITMGGLSKGDTCKVDKAHYNEFLDGMRKAGFPE